MGHAAEQKKSKNIFKRGVEWFPFLFVSISLSSFQLPYRDTYRIYRERSSQQEEETSLLYRHKSISKCIRGERWRQLSTSKHSSRSALAYFYTNTRTLSFSLGVIVFFNKRFQRRLLVIVSQKRNEVQERANSIVSVPL
jgi:hypothetical protein